MCDNAGLNMACGNIRGNIRSSDNEILDYYELKRHKLWFYEDSSILLDQRKQTKLEWLQNPSQFKGDIFNNVGR
jgi:hypothetical protein